MRRFRPCPPRPRAKRAVAVTLSLLSASALLWPPSLTWAQVDYTWTGGAGNQNWNTNGNWSSSLGTTAPPGTANDDNVIFTDAVGASGFNSFVTQFGGPSTAFHINSLQFSNLAGAWTIGGNVDLSIGSGGILQDSTNDQLINLGSSRLLQVVADQTWNLSGGGRLTLLNPLDALSGTLTQTGTGELVFTTSGNVFSTFNLNRGTTTFTSGAIGTANIVNVANVGDGGGTLNVSSESQLTATSITVASGGSSNGTLNVSGASTLSATTLFLAGGGESVASLFVTGQSLASVTTLELAGDDTNGAAITVDGAQLTATNITSNGTAGTFYLSDGSSGPALNVGGGDLLNVMIQDGASGSGSVHKFGGDDLVFEGLSQTFTGGLQIDGGSVILRGDTTLADTTPHPDMESYSPFAVNIASGATFQVDRTDGVEGDWTWGGVVLGTGTFLKSGLNTLTLTSDQDGFLGDVVIDAGTIQINAMNGFNNAASVTVNSAGGLTFGGGVTQTTINNLSGDATSNISLVNANNDPLNLTVDNSQDTVYQGSISGTGQLIKTGTGELRLTGTNNTYSGGTLVTSGRLGVDGALTGNGEVFVGEITPLIRNGFPGGSLEGTNAILGGNGLIQGNVTLGRGGFTSPGDSPGTLTLLSNLTMLDESGLIIEIAGTDQGINYDLLKVLGSASLNGTLDLRFLNGFVPATSDFFDFLSAGQGFTGFFDNVLINGQTPASGTYSLSVVTGGNGSPTLRLGNVTGFAIPEAGSLALFVPGFGPAMLWLLMRQRRRHNRGAGN